MSRHLGRYQLLRPIGRGGMAEVWLARHRGAGGVEKRVVVKRILRERIADPRFLDLFVSEAQISMALAHKNIVPTFDFGRVGDELFLVMEYVDGSNLAVVMREAKKRNLPPSAPLVCHIVFEACQALEYAHGYKDPAGVALGISHRDVTPANLFLSTAGGVKLGDFGLAQATVEVAEAEGATRGTPRYMAPEQAAGGVVGPAADIFALGLILRDCLLFDVLRKGSQEEQLLAAASPVPPMPKTISDEMRKICERATQFEPSDRYLNAKAMSEDLDRALLHARLEEPDDRRPMPERLAAWVESVRASDGDEAPTSAASPQGETVTYLDHGAAEVLAGLGDATMRSMAATGLESIGANRAEATTKKNTGFEPENGDEGVSSGGEHTEDAEDALAAANPDAPQASPWARRAIALLPLGALAYLVVHALSGPPTPSASTAALADAGVVTSVVPHNDEPRIDSPLADAALVPADAGSADAMPPPDARPVHGQPRRNPRPPTEAAPVATTRVGTLRISSAPWATVAVLGRDETCAETPCQLTLPVGDHQLDLRNPVAGLKKIVRVSVRADEVVKIHEVLQAAPR